MGKARPRHKSRRKQGSSQPTGLGLPIVRDSEEEESDMQSKDSEVFINVVEEIQSPDMETRLCGLRALITLSERQELVDGILERKVIKIIAPFLVEKSSEVRNCTAGILRNLSGCGNAQAITRLVREDVMTPLLALCAQYYNEWKPEMSSAEDADTLLQLTNILWNLCETDETALGRFNSSNVVELLLRCVDVDVDLAIAACQCLNTISEDNPVLASALRSHEAALLKLLTEPATTHKKLLLKTLAAGIWCNVWQGRPPPAAVLAALRAALEWDARSQVAILTSDLPLPSPSPSPTASPSVDLESRLAEATALVEAQTIALETLANLVSASDDDMDVESESGEDEWAEEGVDSDCGSGGETQPLTTDPEVCAGLVSAGLVAAVVAKADPFAHNVVGILAACPFAPARHLANKLVALQCRALLCLNNLVGGLTTDDLGGASLLYRTAGKITVQRLTDPSTQDADLVEASTAAVRAIMVRLALEKFTGVTDVEPKHLQVLFDVAAKSEDGRVKANVARTVAAIGTMLLELPADASQPLLLMIGGHLLAGAESESRSGGGGEARLACEALDCLIDLFSDDRTDSAAAHLRLVQRIRSILPLLKAKIRQERKTLGEYSATVSTVMANIGPFVKYKAKRVGAAAP